MIFKFWCLRKLTWYRFQHLSKSKSRLLICLFDQKSLLPSPNDLPTPVYKPVGVPPAYPPTLLPFLPPYPSVQTCGGPTGATALLATGGKLLLLLLLDPKCRLLPGLVTLPRLEQDLRSCSDVDECQEEGRSDLSSYSHLQSSGA